MDRSLELDVRRKIHNCIRKSPGIHFREIQRRTKLATGSLDYHLHFLHKNGLLRLEKDARFTRYYPTDRNFDEKDKEVLGILRQENLRSIILYLLDSGKATPGQIAEALDYKPSNLSWYLKILLDKNIVEQKKKGRFRFYTVLEKERIIKCLVAHKSGFFDKMVDNFIEVWQLDS